MKHAGLVLGAAALPGFAEVEKHQKMIVLQSAWDTINIGDIGHTPGTLRVLEQHLPDVKVVLWASKLDERVTKLLRTRFPKVEILEGSLTGKAERDELLRQAIAKCDLFMRNSGMGQATDFMEWCGELGKPYGVFGQSYFETMVDGKGAAQRIALLDKAAFIYCRDGNTLEILKRNGVKPGVLEFGPDGCFGIDVRDEEKGLATMKRLGLEERKFITIQLRTHTAKHDGVHNPPLNPLYPTPENVADDERRAGVYRELISLWVKQTGMKVLIAPEVKKESIHNKRLIYDLLPPEIQKNVINLEVDEFWNADEAATVFARAHTVVCHEPHSPIIALANGTPILHTYSEFHSPKCWMFRDIGLSEWLLEFDSTPAEQMMAALLKIDGDYPAALARVKKSMDFVHERFAGSMQMVKGILED
ncbi:polysaccharide pyruvyl transferase family protein [Phragmitibacter flavus]|nr:polysaccharide pyruvyl transferase family protein [Phragmitibacter flavus]